MALFYGTYSCGHEGRTDIWGPVKNRQWIADKKFSGLCPECQKIEIEKEIEKANDESAMQSAKLGLPDLEGTEKQVAWANTLRIQIANKFEEQISFYKETNPPLAIHFNEIQEFIMQKKKMASWYINNREDNFKEIIDKIEDEYKEKPTDAIRISDIRVESSVSPKKIEHPGMVEISGDDTRITVTYEKNNDFRQIVKSLGFIWEGVWSRKLSETTGDYVNRAAELGNKLLQNGFTILVLDEKIRTKAINADFEVECTRWIYRRKRNLAINWSKNDSDNIYKSAKKIPTSKWSSPSIIVDVSHYKEVADFAKMYGFRYTESAKKMISAYVNSIEKIPMVNIAESKKMEGQFLSELWEEPEYKYYKGDESI